MGVLPGVVVIGRNEGELLAASLRAALRETDRVVYVDSGSEDGSVELARSLVPAVEVLDRSQPFTAARGRNAGFALLGARYPEVTAVQFVDGDSELQPGWLARAARALEENPRLAVVCGILEEAEPERNRYHRLCAMEWRGPAGAIDACGGIAAVRSRAFLEVGGFRAALAAGEEPDLCFRLRARGWGIERLPAPMAVHHASLDHLGQWWSRAQRSGMAFAAALQEHGPKDRAALRQTLSIWFWAAGVPLAAALAALLGHPWLGLGLLAGYLVLFLRIARAARRAGWDARHARLQACFLLLGKFAQLLGQLRHLTRRAAY